MSTQEKFILWFTGLSASGKTTIAKAVQQELTQRGMQTYHLDGDEVRARAKEHFGFTQEGRDKNIQAAITYAKEYQDQGYVVVASFISPYAHHRMWGKNTLYNFIEVFVDCPLSVCEQRDPKGLYKKAHAGEVAFFTGISDPYEEPTNPDIHLKTDSTSKDDCIKTVLTYLEEHNFIA